MYRILHLFRDEKFTNDFIKFLNEYFKDSYHEIWVYGRHISHVSNDLLVLKNVKRVVNISKRLKTKEIYQFDKIIYHGVFETDIIDFFSKNRKLLKKLYLYFWGGDKFYLKNRICNMKKKYVVHNACGIINILPEEKRYIKKFYNPKGRFFCARYFREYKFLQHYKNLTLPKKNYIAIQIGNSAAKSNHHIAILHRLSKYKDENIKIYVPLSYGDKDYAQIVIKEGRKIFGEKFIGMTEFMDINEYFTFLKSIDIAIFDMNRQQALGNIQPLIYFGKKVYMRNKSVLLRHFRKELHCIIYTTDQIEYMKYEEFIHFSEKSKENNEIAMETVYSTKRRIEEWGEIFNDNMQ